VHERHSERIFATLSMLSVAPERSHGRLHLAGHPCPLLITPRGQAELTAPVCPPLGILPVTRWQGGEVELGPGWLLLMYTDGLVEGHSGDGSGRLNSEGLMGLVDTFRRTRPAGAGTGAWPPGRLLDWLIDEVHKRNGGPVDDDLAVLALRCAPPGGQG
jgi:hypothetical protein